MRSVQREAQKIESAGVLVKDYDVGLCDFPYNHHGQVVYLCWKLDEESINWWHEVDSRLRRGEAPPTAAGISVAGRIQMRVGSLLLISA
jgi:hypothetical protein